MDQLYPIIRRKRRPLVTEPEPVAPAPVKLEPASVPLEATITDKDDLAANQSSENVPDN